jgi:WD40 repeat protein
MSVPATRVPLSSPYKGLAPFDDSDVDALLFFGREWETEVVAANVLASRLTVLYGPSGVGKSSLLRAGVVRALRHSADPSPAVACFGTWAGAPLVGLEESARVAVAEALGREPTDAPGDLTDRLAAWSAELGAELCLLVDQLEELFLYHPAKEGAGGFVDLLPELVHRPGLRVNVLLGVRDDALAQLDVFKERIPGLFMNSLRLDHLDRAAGREAILGPLGRFAAIAGASAAMTIEPALVDDVLDQVSTGKIEPSLAGRGAVEGAAQVGRVETPYLQLVLQRLWEVERARGSSVLRQETFRSLGGAEQIVEDHLDHALSALTPAEQDAAASVFDHLVTPSGTKIAHGVGDLASYASVGERELGPVLDSLARQRILRPLGENGHAGGRYEIFHDVLAPAVLAWRTHHEADAALAEERKRRRRLGWLAAAALVALALMTALAVYAFSQRSEAQQQAREASAQRREAKKRAGQYQEAAAAADAARKRARAKTRVALKQKRRARALKVIADTKTQQAQQAQAAEETQAANARQNEGDAIQAKEDAQEKTRIANEATRKYKSAAKDAKRALRNARLAETRARARQYVALSLAELPTDPEHSAELAVRASAHEEFPAAEDALRAALVAMHVKHVLPAVRNGLARLSANGQALVAGGMRKVRVYRVSDGDLLRTFKTPSVVKAVAASPDGKQVAAGGADGKIRVWEVESGAVRILDHGTPVSVLVWSPAGDVLVSLGTTVSAAARLWSLAGGEPLHLLPHTGVPTAASFSPDGRRLVTVGPGRFAQIFDVRSGTLVRTLESPGGAFMSASFGPGGELVATGGHEGTARVWDLTTGDPRQSFSGHTGPVVDVAFAPDGERLATASTDTLARLWNLRSGILEDAFRGHTGLGVNDVEFAPDNRSVVSAGEDRTARFWAQGQSPLVLLGHKKAVLSAAMTPDGDSIVTSSADGSARVWDPFVDRPLTLLSRQEQAVTTVSVNPAGSQVASGSADGVVQVLSTNGRLIRRMALSNRIVSVEWARGQVLLAASTDGQATAWADAGARLLRTFTHGGSLRAAAISWDGTLVATAGAGRAVKLWRLRDGALLHTLRHKAAVNSVEFDPQGRLVAVASGRSAYLWRTSSGEPFGELKGHANTVTDLAFGDRGRRLATSSLDGVPRLWSVPSLRPLQSFVGHGGAVVSVAFSPDGRWIATAGPRKVAIWKVGGQPPFLFFLSGHEPTLKSVAFGSRDWTIVTGRSDGTVQSYSCAVCAPLKQLVTLAKSRLRALRAEARR